MLHWTEQVVTNQNNCNQCLHTVAKQGDKYINALGIKQLTLSISLWSQWSADCQASLLYSSSFKRWVSISHLQKTQCRNINIGSTNACSSVEPRGHLLSAIIRGVLTSRKAFAFQFLSGTVSHIIFTYCINGLKIWCRGMLFSDNEFVHVELWPSSLQHGGGILQL